MELFRTLSFRSALTLLVTFWLSFVNVGAQFSSRTRIGFRIIVPETTALKSTYFSGISAANGVLRKMRSRHTAKRISPSVRQIAITKEPSEVLNMFCSDIFQNNVNSFFHMNLNRMSAFSKDYVHRVAEELGYPFFSWDPDYDGALEVSLPR